VTAFRAVVLQHFRHPHNRGPLPGANGEAEGANPLCGDRIRVQVLVRDELVAEARFTADACAICIASASVVTDAARGVRLVDIDAIDTAWIHAALGGEPPAGRRRCVGLAVETFHRAVAAAARGGTAP
jgi:nitrogen fixation NifU-like protein